MSKRICHLLITFGNINQDYTQRFLEELSNSSENSHFVFCHQVLTSSQKIEIIHSNQQNKLVGILKYLKFYVINKDFRSMNKKFSKREKFKWIQLVQLKMDVIHIHHLHAIPTSVISFLKKQNIKIVMSLRGRDLLVNTRKENELLELKEKLSLADSIHCISKFMSKKLYLKTGFNSHVIYRGNEILIQSNLKTELIKKNTEIRIVSVGRLVWEKGHIFLIESVKRLRTKGFICKVDIYGEGELKEFLAFRIDQLKLGDTIKLKGFLPKERLRSKYKNYDIAVQPSLSEALSNGLIDLMQHNLPCIISNVGGMPEIIEHNKNGFVFSIEDIEQIDYYLENYQKINFEELVRYNSNLKKFNLQNEIELFNKLYNR